MNPPASNTTSHGIGFQLHLWVGGSLFLLGLVVMIVGYQFDMVAFREVIPEGVTMRFNTALCFSALGASLLAHNRLLWFAKVLSALIVLVALANILETLIHTDLGVDQLFVSDQVRDKYSALPPGRLGLTVSLCFILLSLPILIPENPWLRPWLQAMPLVVLLNCMMNLIGYLFALYPNREMVRISQMALHTALGLAVGSFGLLSLKPFRNLKQLLLKRDAQGQLFRKAVGYIIVVPAVIASVILLLLRNELVNNGYGLTLFVMVFGLTGVIALWSYVDRTNELYQLALDNETLLKAQNEEISRINAELVAANSQLTDSYQTVQEQSITIERLLADKVRLSEERFANLSNSIQTYLFEVDRDLRYTYVNQYSLKQLGKRPEDMLGKTILEVYPEYESSELLAKIKHCLAEKNAEFMLLESPTGDGQVLHYDVAIYPSELGATVLTRDITEQKMVELSLKENQQFISSLLTALPSYVYLYDAQKDELIFANNGLNASMGYTSDDLLGASMATLVSLIYPVDIEANRQVVLDEEVRGVLSQEQIRHVEYRLRAKDGSYFWVQDRSVVYKCTPEGMPLQILGVITSIDEIKSYQIALMEAKARAEDASQAKTQFLANMSHELRNPLNALMGITQIFEKDYQDDAKISQYVNLMRQSANRLLNTIGDVLDLSKIEANKITVNPKPIDLTQALLKSIAVFQPLAEKKGLQLHLASPADAQVSILLDAHLLDQIINNLLTNAIKFTIQGQITLRTVSQKSGAKEYLGFEVRDTGVGMSESFVAEKLFGTFEQESAGFSKAYEGSGLGLHIAKRFVTLMGGTIEVSSEKNIGTTFLVLFQQ